MEPSASDTLARPPNISKTEKLLMKKEMAEDFRKILSEQLISPATGTFFKIIQRDGRKNFICFLCRCHLRTFEVIPHVSGKRHTKALESFKKNEECGYFNGEPLPPGVMKNHNLQLQKTLDQIREPVIGLEYLLEIVYENKSRLSLFFCTLCNKKGVSTLVTSHVTCDTHKFMYIKNHFPTVLRHITADKKKRVLLQHKPVLDKVIQAIEATYGRLKPTQVKAPVFSVDKINCIKMLRGGQHFSEADGETFEKLTIEEVSKENEPRLYENPKEVFGTNETVTCRDRKIDDYGNKLEVFNKLSKDIDDEMDQVLIKHRENPDDHPQYNKEWQNFWKERCMDLRSRGEDPSTYDFKQEWKEFWDNRILVLHHKETESKKMVLKRMLGLLEGPMSLSNFNSDREVILVDEDSFNSRNSSRRKTRSRSPILIDSSAQGRRRDSNSRYRESPTCYRESLSCYRESPLRYRESPSHYRESLSRYRESPSRYRESPSRYRESPSRYRESPSRCRESPSRYRESSSHYGESPTRYKASCSPNRELSRRHKESSCNRYPSHRLASHINSRDSSISRKDRRYSKSPGRSPNAKQDKSEKTDERSRSRGKSSEIIPKKKRREHRDNLWDTYVEKVEINMVALLRQLTALEERLGSLGPKVINLLSSALVMENKKSNSSEELLYNEDNCLLLETVREKLKGQFQAGLLTGVEEKVFRTAIKDVETAIHASRGRKRQIKDELSKDPMVVPGVGTLDKEKISSQIMNTLIAQGKKDITQKELDEMLKVLIKKEGSQSSETSYSRKRNSSQCINNRTPTYEMFQGFKKQKNDKEENEDKKSSMLIDIDSEDDYQFDDVFEAASRKRIRGQIRETKKGRKMDEDPETPPINTLMGTFEKREANSSSVVSNSANINQSLNRKINIISGVPGSSITINEFSIGSRLDNSHDFHKEYRPKHEEAMAASQDMGSKWKNALSASTQPYGEFYSNSNIGLRHSLDLPQNCGDTGMPGVGFNRDVQLSIGSSLLVKPLGFASKNISSISQGRFSPPDAIMTCFNVGGALFKGNVNKSPPFSNIRSDPFSMLERNEFKCFEGKNTLKSGSLGNIRGEMTDSMGDFRDGQSKYRMGQDVYRGGLFDYQGDWNRHRGSSRSGPDDFRDDYKSTSTLTTSYMSYRGSSDNLRSNIGDSRGDSEYTDRLKYSRKRPYE